jgi:hypothetical protein
MLIDADLAKRILVRRSYIERMVMEIRFLRTIETAHLGMTSGLGTVATATVRISGAGFRLSPPHP